MTSTVLFVGTQPLRRRFNPPTLDLERAGRVRPRGKPHGGLWTCPEHPDHPGLSIWGHWRGQNMGPRNRWDSQIWRLRAPAARLLTLATPQAIADALDRYPHDWYADLGFPRQATRISQLLDIEIDHVAVMHDGYDGLEITDHALHGFFVDPDLDNERLWTAHLAVWGWDVWSILWYRWVFTGAPE